MLPCEGNNFGSFEVSLEIPENSFNSDGLFYQIGKINKVILIGQEHVLQSKVKVGENDLTIHYDEKDVIKRANGEWEFSKQVEIKSNNNSGFENLSSSHSTTANASGGAWEEEGEEENGEINQTLWEEAQESNNAKPEASTMTEPTESEEVAEIRKMIERGQEILPMGKYMDIKDTTEMKKIAQQLEDFKREGSEAAKNELFPVPEYEEQFNELIQGLKGKAAGIELEKNPSGSSQSDQPTQPSQADILASIQQENEAKTNNQNNALNQAESENATKEDIANAVKVSGSSFGDENSQESQKRQEALEDRLAMEDPDLYFQTMLDKINVSLKENNLTETELELTEELKDQWIKFKRAEIQDKDQIKTIVQKILEQIIRQGNEKELKRIHELVEKNKQKLLPKNERDELLKDIMKYIEKTKTNTYTKANSSKAEALLREFNSSSKPETTKPNEFPWVPVSLGIGAVGILAVAVLLIKKRKQKNGQ